MANDEENHTEESPLLNPRIAAENEDDEASPNPDGAKKPVGLLRGTLIIMALGALVLVQGKKSPRQTGSEQHN